MSADQQGLLSLANKKEDAFISTGFSHWKKVSCQGKKSAGSFAQHEASKTHRFAMSQLNAQQNPIVIAQVNEQKKKEQETKRRMLVKVFISAR